jgi:transcriptional regulator with XRE-family HTH domain
MMMKYKSIQQYLRISGKTEREFAEMLGISQPFVNELKKGGKRPSPALAFKIEALTGIPFRNLYADSSSKERRPARESRR